ncbi:hypothetical protein [Methylobacterium sp. CM6257]
MASHHQGAGALAASSETDVLAYVDEAGSKGLSRRLTAERDEEIGLFCSLSFPIERIDEMRARFVPGYDRFIAAMPAGAKPHITDAFKSGNEAWAEVARGVREEFFSIIQELMLPVIYEARRLRVDRETHEMHQSWLDEIKAARRSRIKVSQRPSDRRVEGSLMTGLSLKLDCLCADFSRKRVDVLFDETDLAEIYQETVDRLRTLSSGRDYTFKGFDPDLKKPVVRKAKITMRVSSGDFPLDAVHLGTVRVVGKNDPLVLATDITANALLYHLSSLTPDTHLNRPESVAGWVLEERVYGAREDAIEDII